MSDIDKLIYNEIKKTQAMVGMGQSLTLMLLSPVIFQFSAFLGAAIGIFFCLTFIGDIEKYNLCTKIEKEIKDRNKGMLDE